MFTTTKRLLKAACILWLFSLQAAHAGSSMLMISALGGANRIPAAFTQDLSLRAVAVPVERECLAMALYHEARGEPRTGQLAVGATILNRVRSRAYPDTICGVVYQNAHKLNRCQFSFACDRLADMPGNARVHFEMRDIAADLIGRFVMRDTSSKSGPHPDMLEYTHYHRHDVAPSWSKKLTSLGRIGDHVFFRSQRVTRRYNASL